MAVNISSLAPPRRANHRASLALACGVVAAVVVPVAIELTRTLQGADLLDAAWAIPVAAIATVASLLFERGARAKIAWTLEQAGGSRRLQASRILAVAGVCFTLAASIAVGLYEVLLRLEH